ncbi:MAG: hypothetical protein ACI4UX_04480 [Clostridia bacterium]
MGENPSNQGINEIRNGSVKDIADALKKVNANSTEEAVGENVNVENANGAIESEFKVARTNLPEKTGFWTKVKNALLYEVKVELTPYQQKVEDEINDFLHQEVTWQSFKNFLFQEVPITYKGKRIF